jgi:hypothetical protein
MKKYFAVAFAVVLALGGGCKREDPKEKNEATIAAAEDNSKMESEFQEIFDQADNAVRYNPSGKTADIENWLPECATVTRDTVGNIRTVTIVFESSGYGCLCRDGLYRKGKIKVEYSGDYNVVGATKTVTIEGYSVNDMVNETKFYGIKTYRVEEWGENTAQFSVRVSDARAESPGGTVRWNSERVIHRTAGNATPYVHDDRYEITGSSAGTNRNGKPFTCTITQALVKDLARCGLRVSRGGRFVEGEWTLNVEGGRTLTLNYDPVGGAPCDRVARVTLDGQSRNITLR